MLSLDSSKFNFFFSFLSSNFNLQKQDDTKQHEEHFHRNIYLLYTFTELIEKKVCNIL